MISQELIEYIKKSQEKNIPKKNIIEELKKMGWKKSDIEEGFLLSKSSPIPVPLPNKARLPSSKEILKTSFQIYLGRFKTFLGIAALPYLVLIAGIVIFFLLMLVNEFLPEMIIFTSIFLGIFLLVFIITVIAVFSWANIAMTVSLRDSSGIIDSYKNSRNLVLSYLWITLIAVPIILLGYCFFFIPGIILTVWFTLFQYVLVFEDKKGIDCLLKSKAYMSGFTASVIWRFIIYGIVIFFIYLIPYILNIIIFGFKLGEEINNIVSVFFRLFITPLSVIFTYIIFKKLVEIKGRDIPQNNQKSIFIMLACIGAFFIISLIAYVVIFGSHTIRREKPFTPKENFFPIDNDNKFRYDQFFEDDNFT